MARPFSQTRQLAPPTLESDRDRAAGRANAGVSRPTARLAVEFQGFHSEREKSCSIHSFFDS
ncbi:hypothetical protein [Microlunatus speluncae]|uniref:hypothetical protein n=1 Tax=Microlunatus speluncae TaxID=2594267 RepID=UPI0013755355|nr:hypothetical protein [Microlunatus speluncae]